MAEYWNSYNMNTEQIRPTIPVAPQEISQGKQSENALRLQQMTTGETLQGEVIFVKGNEVLVRLSDNTVISAQLSKDLQVMLGQSLIFELQNGTDGQIALRALFTNLAQGEVLGKAISDAGLPLNRDTAEMVEALMKEELPIGKNMLQSVYREVMEFDALKPAEIVKMHKLGMNVNEASVKQFSAFIHYEERIASTTSRLINVLQEEVLEFQHAGKHEQAFTLGKEILNLITESQVVFGENAQPQVMEPQMRELFSLALQTLAEELNLLTLTGENVTDTHASSTLSDSEVVLHELFTLLSETNTDKVTSKDFFQSLLFQFENGNLPEKAMGLLFDKSEIRDFVGKQLSELWLLKPSAIEDGKNINDFYNRLNQHVTQLSNVVAETISSSQNLTQSLHQMKENVDFLNQLNQMIPYVQLPLRMNGQSATGDLYVYADKQSLAEKKDNISAALHLDMEHLGHLDVYVKLNNAKVETDFKVDSDATLQFLSEHIDVLNERLKKRGYDLEVNLERMEEAKTIRDDIMIGKQATDDDSIQQQPIAYYRLDVRA